MDIPDDLARKLEAFKPLIEVVLEEEITLEDCAAMMLEYALSVMLADVMGKPEPEVMIASMQQLATRHPEAVYGFVADAMKAGEAVERERARRRIRTGFGPPEEA